MKTFILILAMLSLVSCETCTPPDPKQEPVHVLHSKDGKEQVWDTNLFPLRLDIDSRFGPEAIEVLVTVVEQWESTTGRDLFRLDIISDEIAILNPAGGHVTMTPAKLSRTLEGNHLGNTSRWTVKGHTGRIHSQKVEIDESVLKDMDLLRAVGLHELGHVLLLSHDFLDPDSLMILDVTQSGLVILPKHILHAQERYGHVLML